MIFDGRYRSVILPGVEDSNSRTTDAQLAARVGLWLDGQVDDWCCWRRGRVVIGKGFQQHLGRPLGRLADDLGTIALGSRSDVLAQDAAVTLLKSLVLSDGKPNDRTVAFRGSLAEP